MLDKLTSWVLSHNIMTHDTEELTMLGLLGKIGNKINEVVDSLNVKTDRLGNHQGTWQGLNPVQTEGGIQALVNQNISLVKKIGVQPESYGAIGDGVTDDSQAIRDMVLDAITNGYNIEMNKKYYLATPIVINAQGKKLNLSINGSVKPLTSGFDITYVREGNIKIAINEGGSPTSIGVKFTDCYACNVIVSGTSYNGIVCKMGGNKQDNTPCMLMNVDLINTRYCYQALEHGDNILNKYQDMFGQYKFICDLDSVKPIQFQNSNDITIVQLENHFFDISHTLDSLRFNNCGAVHCGNIAVGGRANSLISINSGAVDIDKLYLCCEDDETRVTRGLSIGEVGAGYVKAMVNRIYETGCKVVLADWTESTSSYIDVMNITTSWGGAFQIMVEKKGVDLGYGFFCKYTTTELYKKPLQWFTPTLLNGWANISGEQVIQYAVDTEGFIHFRGSANVGTSTTMFTLPVGYRPIKNKNIAFVTNLGSTVGVITTIGDVGIGTISGITFASLDMLTI